MGKKINKEHQGNKDYSIPNNVKSELERICKENKNTQDLISKFSKLLADYRYYRDIRNTTPSTSANIEHLEKILKNIETLKENIDLISSDARAHMDTAYYQQFSTPFHNLLVGFVDALDILNWTVNSSLGRFDSFSPSPGERRKTLEHELLANTANLIEENSSLRKIASAEMAAKLLTPCGVPGMPTTPSKAREIVNKHSNKYP